MLAYAKSQNGSIQFYKALEPHIWSQRETLSCQQLANIVYSYYKSSNASTTLFSDLIPTISSQMKNFKPSELTCILYAYQQSGFFGNGQNPDFLKQFEDEFKSKHEMMNAEDISKYYFCFTEIGFYGEGRFYKYL